MPARTVPYPSFTFSRVGFNSLLQSECDYGKALGTTRGLLGITDGLEDDSTDILTLPYAPYLQLFPHAIVNVHQPPRVARSVSQGSNATCICQT